MLQCYWLKPLGRSLEVLWRHLPLGVAWVAFRIQGKRAYRMLLGFASAYEEAWEALCSLAGELNPYSTQEMLPEWEEALGLPDKCLWQASSVADRRAQVIYRLSKRRWTTAQDWIDLASLFGLTITVTPGWLVQKPALYAFQYPKRYDLFPKLGRFRVYVDVLGQSFGGYDYGKAGRGVGYPVPYGLDSPLFEAFRCIIDRVRPANVVVIWNSNPLTNYCYAETFEETFSDTFCSDNVYPET